MLPRKLDEDGWLKCSRCRHPRPTSWYTKDRHALLGLGYKCRACRPKGNKYTLVFPDFDVIPASKVKLLPRLNQRMEPGSWERVVARAAIATVNEVVVVHVGKNYYAHYSAYMGLLDAAKRRKLQVTIQHGSAEVFVRAKKRKTNGW